MKQAGYIASERGIRTINELMGLEYEIDPEPKQTGFGRELNDINQEGSNPNKVKY